MAFKTKTEMKDMMSTCYDKRADTIHSVHQGNKKPFSIPQGTICRKFDLVGEDYAEYICLIEPDKLDFDGKHLEPFIIAFDFDTSITAEKTPTTKVAEYVVKLQKSDTEKIDIPKNTMMYPIHGNDYWFYKKHAGNDEYILFKTTLPKKGLFGRLATKLTGKGGRKSRKSRRTRRRSRL